MSTISELKQTLSNLPTAELESIADWLGVFVEDAWYRTYHVREAQPEYISEDPLFMSFEEYMAFEETSPYRHEFVNGAVYAMSGASLAHNRIAKKLTIAFDAHLRGGPCEAFLLEAKLEIRPGRDEIVYYPDVMVSCRPAERTTQAVRNPKLVVEILSPTSAHIDRREKAMTYRRVESIEEYVLLAQDRYRLIMHRREQDWHPMLYSVPDAMVEFRSIGLSMPLAQIYEGTLIG